MDPNYASDRPQENPRIVVFIDGTWIWHNIIAQNSDHQSKFDLGNLPAKLVQALQVNGEHFGTVLCASIPVNYDSRDNSAVSKRRHFFEMLQNKYNFTTEIYEIDFHGRRLNQYNRDPRDNFSPKEKCVDIATASNLFVHNYDIAILITGDKDFLPAIQKTLNHYHARKIIVANFQKSCSQQLVNFSHPRYRVHLIDPSEHQLS